MADSREEPDDNQNDYIIAAIMQRILRWFGVSVEQSVIEAAIGEVRILLHEFSQLQEALRDVISEAGSRGIEQGLSQLDNMKEHVVQLCIENQQFITYKEKLTNNKLNSSTGAAAGCITKLAARPTATILVKEGTQQIVKSTMKNGYSAGIKIGSVKLSVFAARKASTHAVKQSTRLVFIASNPVGIVADLAQAGCEAAGYKNVGKGIGVTGNMAAGAMMGVLGGPLGVVAGALGGLAIWGTGEVVGSVIEGAFK